MENPHMTISKKTPRNKREYNWALDKVSRILIKKEISRMNEVSVEKRNH